MTLGDLYKLGFIAMPFFVFGLIAYWIYWSIKESDRKYKEQKEALRCWEFNDIRHSAVIYLTGTKETLMEIAFLPDSCAGDWGWKHTSERNARKWAEYAKEHGFTFNDTRDEKTPPTVYPAHRIRKIEIVPTDSIKRGG